MTQVPQLLLWMPRPTCRFHLAASGSVRYRDTQRDNPFPRCRSLRRRPRLFFNNDLDGFESFALLVIIAIADTDQLITILRQELFCSVLLWLYGFPNTPSASSQAIRWTDHPATTTV